MPTTFFGTVRQKFFDANFWYPLICIKFFDNPNFLKHWRDAHEIFRHCETKNFRRKNVICPLLSMNFFRYQKISAKQKDSFTKLFVLVLWDKKFRQYRDAPPLLCMKIFYKRIFLKHQSVFQWNISVQWDKNFDGKSWYYPPPPLIQTFSVPEISETLKGSSTKFFGTVRQKIFDGKSWYSPALLSKFFLYPKLMKH